MKNKVKSARSYAKANAALAIAERKLKEGKISYSEYLAAVEYFHAVCDSFWS